ncbi:hypothetical protein [Actinomadura rugatobispora]|uniref:DUF4429 domain-containing protein n=1 Tax=Actinomadura rugatobispora TaxID=1994 RepID=A0ABW1A9U5_9ACTN|nr:hypothetical protein GCM10010200_099420 [Actinomadura rugatobispora]
MAANARERWVLEHNGRRLEVESPPGGSKREIRMFVDGEQVAEEHVSGKKAAKLTHDDLTVKATWDWLGHLGMVALVPASTDLEVKDVQDVKDLVARAGETWFTPPEGSRAARRERLARRYPRLYASRHVAAAVAKVLLPLLGIAALIRIPKPDIDLPEVNLPDPPDLPRPRIPWPDIDLPSIPWPDLTLPGWVQAILETAKYWGPITAAVFIAVQEYQRRKKQREKAAERAAAAQDPAGGQPGERESDTGKDDEGETDREGEQEGERETAPSRNLNR